MNKSKSLIISVVVYAVSIVAIAYVWDYLPEMPLLWRLLIADVIATVIVFAFSVVFNNSSIYDPYWSVQPVVIALFYSRLTTEMSLLESVTLFLVILYGGRLTLNFYIGWPGLKHEDWRYQDFRKRSGSAYWLVSFLGIHLMPTIIVFIACVPLYYIFVAAEPSLNPWFFFGAITVFSAVALARIADEQLRNFRSDPENKGKIMREGLWNFCRHPNYLGEILTWWGLFFLSLSAVETPRWIIICPATVTLLFLVVSIPMLEARQLKSKPEYAGYIKEVPKLIPLKLCLVYQLFYRKRV